MAHTSRRCKTAAHETLSKITISLPKELIAFADERAKALSTSRSRVLSMALAAVKLNEDERLAASGYRFYAEEASEFAASARRAIAEAWSGDYLPSDDESSEHHG